MILFPLRRSSFVGDIGISVVITKGRATPSLAYRDCLISQCYILILDLSGTQLQIINLLQEMKKAQLRQKISIETI